MLYQLLTFRFWIFDSYLIWTCIYSLIHNDGNSSKIQPNMRNSFHHYLCTIYHLLCIFYDLFFFSKQSRHWIFFVSSRKVIILNILLSHNAYPYTSQIFQPFFLIMVILTSIWHCLLCSFTSWVALWKHAPWLNFLSWALYSQVARNNFNREPSLRSVLSDPLS